MQQLLDCFVARLRMTPPEVLAHQIDPGLEQIECRAERIGDGLTRRGRVIRCACGLQLAHGTSVRTSGRPDKHSRGRMQPVDVVTAQVHQAWSPKDRRSSPTEKR